MEIIKNYARREKGGNFITAKVLGPCEGCFPPRLNQYQQVSPYLAKDQIPGGYYNFLAWLPQVAFWWDLVQQWKNSFFAKVLNKTSILEVNGRWWGVFTPHKVTFCAIWSLLFSSSFPNRSKLGDSSWTRWEEFKLAAAGLGDNSFHFGSGPPCGSFHKSKTAWKSSVWVSVDAFRSLVEGYEFGSCYLALLGLAWVGPPD